MFKGDKAIGIYAGICMNKAGKSVAWGDRLPVLGASR